MKKLLTNFWYWRQRGCTLRSAWRMARRTL